MVSGPTDMMFEKEGIRANQWNARRKDAAQEGHATWVHIKACIVDTGARLRHFLCQPCMVRRSGGSFCEKEKQITNVRCGAYQRSLDKLDFRLKQPQRHAAPPLRPFKSLTH